MKKKIQIRLGGYGPPETSFSKAIKFIGNGLASEYGDDIEIKYIWNIMDLGFRGEDILWLVEHGFLTIGYQSTSYLTERVPELGFVDLPFLFKNNKDARNAMDGRLGKHLSTLLDNQINYKTLGFFENGFRHISNRLKPIRSPEDLKNMRIRVLPSEVQARTFQLMGAQPVILDLSEAIEGIKKETLDAQENPFANTVTYGVHKFHPYHTMSKHFYISRALMMHRTTYYSLPDEIKDSLMELTNQSIKQQRKEAEKEVVKSKKLIEEEGCQIVELTPSEERKFADCVKPQLLEARKTFGNTMFKMLENLE